MDRRAARLQAQNKLECALRVSAGASRGLSHNWRSGVATLRPGEIEFARHPGGFRFVHGHTLRLPVTEIVDTVPWRRTGIQDLIRGAYRGDPVLRIRTAGATLEWDLPFTMVEWATQQLVPQSE